MKRDRRHRSRKTWRRPYSGSKRFDRTCRSHGSCDYCASGRQHNTERRKLEAEGA